MALAGRRCGICMYSMYRCEAQTGQRTGVVETKRGGMSAGVFFFLSFLLLGQGRWIERLMTGDLLYVLYVLYEAGCLMYIFLWEGVELD